jgi:hypothetical protein
LFNIIEDVYRVYKVRKVKLVQKVLLDLKDRQVVMVKMD